MGKLRTRRGRATRARGQLTGVGSTAASAQSGVAWEPPPEETPWPSVLTISAGTLWSLGSKLHTWASFRLLGREFEGGHREYQAVTVLQDQKNLLNTQRAGENLPDSILPFLYVVMEIW